MRYASWEEFRSNSPVVQHHLAQFATRPLPDMRAADWFPIPDAALLNAEALGRPVASFTLPGESPWFGIGLVLPVCGVGLGTLCAIALIAEPGFNELPAMAFFSILLAGLGTWLAFFRPLRLPVTLWVCENGILRQSGKQFHGCLWDEVSDFQVDQQYRLPRFRIRIRDQDAEFGTGRNPAILPIMEYIETKLSAAQFLPELKHIFEGECVAFGQVALDRAGFRGLRFFAYWSEIERVVSDPEFMFVIRRGQADWDKVRYGEVSFPALVLAISHVMIEEEKHLS